MANSIKLNGWSKVLVSLGISLLVIAVAWGTVKTKVGANSDNIEKKLDKEVFQMYCEQQKTADEKTEKTLDKIDGKLDKLIAGD